ncbi:MAG: PH domain-containing protein [Actinomycetota bacterium]|nr:PH domain-containing protein [Actinomycetota bacterium]MDQ2956672.1 PH domain-containing protein [Actinomycetota bacterium]
MTSLELREPANLVCRRALWYWTARALGCWLVVIAIEVFVLIKTHGDRGPNVVVLTITTVLGLVHVLVMPTWRYRVHRWEATDVAVYTRSGWFNQERRIAPLSRIQTIDTERGPIEQLFRLSNVTVTTASAAGPLKIHGLAPAVADRLVAELTAITSASTGDAT